MSGRVVTFGRRAFLAGIACVSLILPRRGPAVAQLVVPGPLNGSLRTTLEAVIRARSDAVAAQGGAAAQATQENVLVDALKNLLALRESYPDLKASTQFLDLQQQLVVTEDRIQAARRFYNANVRDYNTRVETFPSLLVARIGGFAKRDYFEIEPAVRDSGAPEVTLS